MLYKHYHTHSKTSNNKDAAINKLTELCTTTKDGITPQTPRLFTELVHILKELNSQDLTDVYEQSQMESFCIDNNERVKLVHYIFILFTCSWVNPGMNENYCMVGSSYKDSFNQ